MCVCARLTQPLASQFHPDANGEQRKEHSIDEVIKYRFVNYGIPSALFRIRAHSQSLAAVVGSARNVFIFIAIQFAFLLFPIHFGWMGNSHTTKTETICRWKRKSCSIYFFFAWFGGFFSLSFVAATTIINTFPFNFTYALAAGWPMY